MKKSLFVSLLSLSIAFGLQAQTEPEKTPLTGKSPSAGAKTSDDTNAKPIAPSNKHPSATPADDFLLYANGGWIKRTEIPPEYSRRGSCHELIEHNTDALRAIAET